MKSFGATTSCGKRTRDHAQECDADAAGGAEVVIDGLIREDGDVEMAQPEARKAALSQRAHNQRVRNQLPPLPPTCALHAHAHSLHAHIWWFIPWSIVVVCTSNSLRMQVYYICSTTCMHAGIVCAIS